MAAMLPSLGKAASLPGDLVQEIQVEAGVDAAQDVGPPDVGDAGEEGVHLSSHLPPRCRGLGFGRGWWAGSLFHTRPQQPTSTAWGLLAAVSPLKRLRRRRGRRCQLSGGSSQPTTPPCRVGCNGGARYQRHL